MKKLIPPTPENTPQPLERAESFKKRPIPDLSKFNIKSVDNLKSRLDSIKMENHQSDFLQSIKTVLDLYDPEDLHYNENIVFFVMQEVEKYLLKGKIGASKEQLCIECCQSFFNNDKELVSLIIKLLMPKLSQVKFTKRQILKLIRFFSNLF
jgi:hypothetical protein